MDKRNQPEYDLGFSHFFVFLLLSLSLHLKYEQTLQSSDYSLILTFALSLGQMRMNATLPSRSAWKPRRYVPHPSSL